MENTLYVALSRQMILRREMDIVANNIANADTPGFKVEAVISETDQVRIPGMSGPLSQIQFVLDTGLARDFGQGALQQTGRPLDIAIEGEAFFQINTAAGTRYTRDGRFALDAEGRLVNAAGNTVAGDGGREIELDPAGGEIAIATDGTISQGGARVGKIAAFRFASLQDIEKTGDGLYRAVGDQVAEAAPDVLLRQGMIEGSNVNPVLEITRMIEVSREYERIARIMEQTQQLERTAIERLGRVN